MMYTHVEHTVTCCHNCVLLDNDEFVICCIHYDMSNSISPHGSFLYQEPLQIYYGLNVSQIQYKFERFTQFNHGRMLNPISSLQWVGMLHPWRVQTTRDVFEIAEASCFSQGQYSAQAVIYIKTSNPLKRIFLTTDP